MSASEAKKMVISVGGAIPDNNGIIHSMEFKVLYSLDGFEKIYDYQATGEWDARVDMPKFTPDSFIELVDLTQLDPLFEADYTTRNTTN